MIEVLKQALMDAKRNERHNNVAETRYWLNQYKLIAEQAIAELESQKPVACQYCHNSATLGAVYFDQNCVECVKRMSHPPQRTWVGLTEEQRNNIEDSFGVVVSKHVFDAIETKLKEKNSA